MSRIVAISGTLLVSMFLANSSSASSDYTIDQEHTTVSFRVGHGKWSKYQGIVRKVMGKIVFDKEHIERSTVQVEMNAMSVDTMNVGRDFEVQGYGMLEAAKNPKITFTSTSVEKTGENTGTIVGNMGMAGVTRPVTLAVIFDGEGLSPWDNAQRVAFSAAGTINTSDFGFKDLIRLEIGPMLDFSIEVEATTY